MIINDEDIDEFYRGQIRNLTRENNQLKKEKEEYLNELKKVLDWLKEHRPHLQGCGAPIMLLNMLIKGEPTGLE